VSDAAPPDAPAGRALTYTSYSLVLLLALLLAVWGAFLVPLRVGGVPVPVSWVIAVVGNGLLGWVGGRLLGRLGAAGPGVVWLFVALAFGSQRAEGDLVVPGTSVGLVFLVAGAIASAVAYGAVPRSRGGGLSRSRG
jgi:hypothetical protein